MRLNEMYYLVWDTIDRWFEPKFDEIRRAPKVDANYCDNLTSFVELLSPLGILPSVKGGLDTICGLSQDVYTGKRVFLSSSDVSTVKKTVTKIYQSLLAMKEMCETLGVEPRKEGFDVKLPPDITLQDLSKLTKDINTVFSQCPLLRDGDGIIQLNGVDVGSKWLVFTVVGAGFAGILSKLADLVDKVVVIRSHWLTCKEQEERVRILKLSTDILESTVSTNIAIMDKFKENAIEELSEKYGVTDHEERGRLKHSLDILSEWSNKGMEIYAAIGAPAEVKAVFPTVEKQALPAEAIKMLGEPKNVEE